MSAVMGPIEMGFRQQIIAARGRMTGVADQREKIAELQDLVRRLRSELSDRDEQITRLSAIPRNRASRIIEQVCDKHQVTPGGLKSPRRDRELAQARHECSYRLRYELEMSLPAIGRLLGNRDHTTILNSINQFEKTLKESAGD